MKKTISGIRGIVGGDLTLKDVMYFCNNFSALIKAQKCVIGRDTRPSGYMIAQTVSSTLRKNGIDVFDLGISPTPVVIREAREYGAGIVVTASHNPIQWNGLKFILNGRGINEKELTQIVDSQNTCSKKIGICENISTSYVDDAKKLIGVIETHPKITADIGGGAARDFVPKLLSELGCQVQTINEELSKCSRSPDPTSDNLTQLCSAIGDIGFAFDLDSDRLVVVKDGKKQTPDVTLGLGVAKSLELGFKKFVLSLDSSVAVEKFIKNSGGSVERSKVGEANVIDMMLKSEAQAGGEGSSGGFILRKFNSCRDGILTSGLIASMLGNTNFAEILSFMESFKQIREKVSIDSKVHDKVIEEVTKKLSTSFSEIITIDGIKGIIDEDNWILIRKSNTEDVIRISAESNDYEKCKKITSETRDLVNQCYEKVK